MKKSLFLIALFIGFISLGLFPNRVEASNGSISVTSSSNTVIVGNTFEVTITLYSQAGIGSWNFCVGYDTSKLTLVSSNLDSTQCMRAGVMTSVGQTSASYKMTFRAKASGSASIYINDSEVYDQNESYMSISKGSKSFTLRTQQEIEASYSKNNYLSSLSIDGVELLPTFNKDTMDYSVELAPETKKIVVQASVEDNTASISGTGERDVVEGDNVIDVIVTAQNGTSRTYHIKATVKEFNPISVKVNGKEYTVVRKKDALTPPNHYVETTVKIGEEEVPAFKSDITKYTLVGLKDDKGNQNFYIYDNGKYTLYKEYNFNKIVLYPMSVPIKEIPKNYQKTSVTYNNEKIEAYKIHTKSKYSLIYAMNVETGKIHFYMYDEVEDTVQIYNREELEVLEEETSIYLKVALGFGVLSIALIGILGFLLLKRHKK